MLSAKQSTNSMPALPIEAQAELGVLQAQIQNAIEAHLQPKRLYFGRFGHDTIYFIHFYFVPMYDWIEALFWLDERSKLLQTFCAINSALLQIDGAELMLFVWREFCERAVPPPI